MKLSRILVLLFAIILLQSVLSLAEGYPCAGILLKTSNVRKEASQKSDKLGEFKNGETSNTARVIGCVKEYIGEWT